MKINRSLPLSLLLAAWAALSPAAPIDADRALRAAREFVNTTPALRAPAPGGNSMSLAYECRAADDRCDYFVFNRGKDGGFVVVSGDDRTIPILGYSDRGAFDPATLPDNLRWWLGQYSQEIRYLQEHPDVPVRRATRQSRAVNPLVTCNWNQSAPYNDQCPTYTIDDETKRAVTGCVATAMAQIMYYHRWPAQGVGSNDYYWSVGGAGTQHLSADFSASTYEWDLMLDEYDTESDAASSSAVAKLMSDVGISVDMMYNDGSSGAYSQSVPTSLSNYFKYDKDIRIVYRSWFGIDGWESLLRDELDAGRPVYYSGSASDGGHAFVLDGYNAGGYFHVNWGWGGLSTGYFIVSMLNPLDQGIGSFDGGYNSNQMAVVGIQPEQSVGSPDAFNAFYEQLTPEQSSAALGEEVTLSVTHAALVGGKNWTSLNWGACILNEDESRVMQEPALNCDASEINTGYYYSATIDFTPAVDLPEGNYHVRLIYQADDLPYRYFSSSTDAPDFVLMEVRDGVAHFSTASRCDLALDSLAVNSTTLYADNVFEITATVSNSGLEYKGGMQFALLRNGSKQATTDDVLVNIGQGKRRTFSSRMTAPSSPGQYQVALFDETGLQLGGSVAVTVERVDAFALELASPLRLKSEVMPADNVEATVDVSNTGGAFMGAIELCIMPLDEWRIKSRFPSQIVTIGTGETQTVTFKGSFGGAVGNTYRVSLRDPNRTDAYYLWGDFAYLTVGDYTAPGITGDVTGDGIVDVADINAIINLILSQSQPEDFAGNPDITGDGIVDVADINAIINLILVK